MTAAPPPARDVADRDARELFARELGEMASTGRNPRTGRRIGAALARALPKLIAAFAALLDARRGPGRHAHG